ncbi:group III truncated hemoglobin [Woodsholea maritima]|uniref:group III truncated hemoglobin n=1 Tax=Woodsholea maritima TaxID=240237 RepID=UPI00035CF534|nr:group III truncated hemoglobin [Woodsholea maritima]
MTNIFEDFETGVTQEIIQTQVHTFYGRIQDHEVLGPIFNAVIQDRWPEHLNKMCDFWSSITLGSRRFEGNPAVAHMRHKTIRPEHFVMWLALWEATAKELFAEDIAQCFIQPAHRMGRNLSQMLFAQP